MNLSNWDSIPTSRIRRNKSSLTPSHLTVEFDRTKKTKVFTHKLGNIDFSRERDLNALRNQVIEKELGSIVNETDEFKYTNVGHIYSNKVIVNSNNTLEPEYDVYSHGHPIKDAKENCAMYGLQCADGGSDTSCAPGKCLIGRLKRSVKGTKWRYESINTYGQSNLPIVYYIGNKESVKLKPITKGYYDTLTGEDYSEVVTIGVDKPASAPITIHLPPSYYYTEDFINSLVNIDDTRLELVTKKPLSTLIGVEKQKEKFIRGVVIKSFPNTSESIAIDRVLSSPPSQELVIALNSIIEGLSEVWKNECEIISNALLEQSSSGLEYLSSIYDSFSELFTCIIQEIKSSLSNPRVSFDKDRIARPVYSRLPGISESYRSDPAFSETETPAQWLLSGVDDFLSKKKDAISSFFRDYVDPDSCIEPALDWIAQHVGLTEDLWNPDWSREVKEAMIRNAFGWWDRRSDDDFTKQTPKGEALNKFPFTNPEWTNDSDEDNLLSLKLDEIETIVIDEDGNYVTYHPFKSLSESFSSLVNVNSIRINKDLWNGLIESKGSLLGVMFLVSIFGLKSHSPEELEIIDAERKLLKPKSGLRNAEISAPPLLPHKYDVLQVGTTDDAEVKNYVNQLIAGVSRVSSVSESKNVFFRVPYYYNRDGKSWDKVAYIAKNWMPSNLNVRIQYPYLSADLWAVGDAFFEPDIITNN